MYRLSLTIQADAALTGLTWPLLPLTTAAIDRLCESEGTEPPSDPIPLIAPNRQIVIVDPQDFTSRLRVVFCTYPAQRLLRVSLIEPAPIF